MGEGMEANDLLCSRNTRSGRSINPHYDLAGTCFVLNQASGSQQAITLLDEAHQRFDAVAKESAKKAVDRMASACLTEQGDCLCNLGRLDEAAATYEESIRRAEQLDAALQVAVGKSQLGTVFLEQRRYPEALAAYAEVRERFTQLEKPGSVAVSWHQTGMVYAKMEKLEAAEDAYRKSLALEVRLGNVLGRLEEAAAWLLPFIRALQAIVAAAAIAPSPTPRI